MDWFERLPGLLIENFGGLFGALLVVLVVTAGASLWALGLVVFVRRQDRRQAAQDAARYAPIRKWIDR